MSMEFSRQEYWSVRKRRLRGFRMEMEESWGTRDEAGQKGKGR